MINRRFGLPGLLGLLLVLIWFSRLFHPWSDYTSWRTKISATNKLRPLAHVEAYYTQAFAPDTPPLFPFPELRATCAAADWDHREAYLDCRGMAAGMASIMSQVQVCFKMAAETGSHLVLPRMPLRDSHNLLEFNFLNSDAYLPYDQWFDADHLRRQLAAACPRMRILHPDELDKTVSVARKLEVLCADAPAYELFHGYFWVGRPYKVFFNEQYDRKLAALEDEPIAEGAAEPDPAAPLAPSRRDSGITLVAVDSKFLLFRITDDPTGRDRRLWTELAHLIRFRPNVRTVLERVAEGLSAPAGASYFGVHFRAENDSIWSSAEHQMSVDLDALDRAWGQLGQGTAKPIVYLACGDQAQTQRFSNVAKERGWATTDKWRLLQEQKQYGDAATSAAAKEALSQLQAMSFDHQGAVDLGIMMRSSFFIGLQGSSFSSTIGNRRDVLGRYRGSSFDYPDDGARTHLFNDVDATQYACCL